jgi:hypothetical protein
MPKILKNKNQKIVVSVIVLLAIVGVASFVALGGLSLFSFGGGSVVPSVQLCAGINAAQGIRSQQVAMLSNACGRDSRLCWIVPSKGCAQTQADAQLNGGDYSVWLNSVYYSEICSPTSVYEQGWDSNVGEVRGIINSVCRQKPFEGGCVGINEPESPDKALQFMELYFGSFNEAAKHSCQEAFNYVQIAPSPTPSPSSSPIPPASPSSSATATPLVTSTPTLVPSASATATPSGTTSPTSPVTSSTPSSSASATPANGYPSNSNGGVTPSSQPQGVQPSIESLGGVESWKIVLVLIIGVASVAAIVFYIKSKKKKRRR